MWSEVFVLSSKLGFGEADRIQLARRVAGGHTCRRDFMSPFVNCCLLSRVASLKDARRHGDAATVLLDYAKVNIVLQEEEEVLVWGGGGEVEDDQSVWRELED